MNSMTDICANNHQGNPESVAAHAAISSKKRAMWDDILEFLADNPSTCDEYEEYAGARHQTASARFSELKALGCIKKVGSRPTRSGCSASVYALKGVLDQ